MADAEVLKDISGTSYFSLDDSGNLTLTGLLTAVGLTSTGVLAAPNGTAAAPSLTFANDTDTGLYRVAANQIGVGLGGVAALALAGSAPTFAAATDTAGQDLYLYAASAGASATTAKAGGLVSLVCGAGSAGSTTVAGGVGGALSLTAGAGGAKAGTGAAAGGAGGATSLTAGAGGATASSGTDAGGAGGAVTIAAGAGGNATAGTGNGGAGGSVSLNAAQGGTSAGGSAGVAGLVKVGGTNPVPFALNVTRSTISDAATLTDAQTRGQVLYQDASGGNVTMVTRTGTQYAAAFPDMAVGNAIMIFCASNHATNTSTISGGTDVTLVGSGAVTQTGGKFLLIKTAATTFDLVRVG